MSNAAVATKQAASRIDSLDLVRGIVMVLMASDHVRVNAGVPAGSPDPAVFFTRWITRRVRQIAGEQAIPVAQLHLHIVVLLVQQS